MVEPERLLTIDYPALISVLGAIPIVFMLTKQQTRAILDRDNHRCQFPIPHLCKGKLVVHHINGESGDKSDIPSNLITVCRKSNWKKIHNGDGNDYHEKLEEVAKQNTASVEQKGWIFPN